MKVNIIPWCFEPTHEFANVIGNRSYRDIMFDSDVTRYIESHSVLFRGRKVCRGRENSKFLIGFAGCCEVLEVDEARNWMIKYDNQDRPYIQYVTIKIENEFVSIHST